MRCGAERFMAGFMALVEGRAATEERVALGSMPYGFLTISQFDTEAILRSHLQRHGGAPAVRLGHWSASRQPMRLRPGSPRRAGSDGVPGGMPIPRRLRDGAHSVVRKGLGIEYEGRLLSDDLHARRRAAALEPPARVRSADHATSRTASCATSSSSFRSREIRARYRVSLAAPPELQSRRGRPQHAAVTRDAADGALAPVLASPTNHLGPALVVELSHQPPIVQRYAPGGCSSRRRGAHPSAAAGRA